MPFFTGKRPFSARRKRCRPAIALPRWRELRPCRRLQGREGTDAPYSSICHKSRRQPVSAAIGFFFLNFCTEPNGAKSPCLRDFFHPRHRTRYSFCLYIFQSAIQIVLQPIVKFYSSLYCFDSPDMPKNFLPFPATPLLLKAQALPLNQYPQKKHLIPIRWESFYL